MKTNWFHGNQSGVKAEDFIARLRKHLVIEKSPWLTTCLCFSFVNITQQVITNRQELRLFFINFAYHTFAFCVHLHDVGHKECKNFIVFVQVVIVFIVWSRQVGLNLIERLSLLKWASKFSFVSIKFPLKESQDEFKVGAEKMRFFALEYTAHPLARFSENVSRYYATCFACHQVDLVKRDLSSIRLAQVKGFRDRITVY